MITHVQSLQVGGKDVIHCSDPFVLDASQNAVWQVDVVFNPPIWWRVTRSKVFGVTHDKSGNIKMMPLNRKVDPIPFVDNGEVSQ